MKVQQEKHYLHQQIDISVIQNTEIYTKIKKNIARIKLKILIFININKPSLKDIFFLMKFFIYIHKQNTKNNLK